MEADTNRVVAGTLGLSLAIAFLRKPKVQDLVFSISGGTLAGWYAAPIVAKKLMPGSYDWLVLTTAVLASVGGVAFKAALQWSQDKLPAILDSLAKRFTGNGTGN